MSTIACKTTTNCSTNRCSSLGDYMMYEKEVCCDLDTGECDTTYSYYCVC